VAPGAAGSLCDTVCGDGIVAGQETCDDGQGRGGAPPDPHAPQSPRRRRRCGSPRDLTTDNFRVVELGQLGELEVKGLERALGG